MSAERGVLLHGEWWGVGAVDQATRDEMSRHIEALESVAVVASSQTGADVDDPDALIVLIVLESFDSLAEYRGTQEYLTMAKYIQPLGLYPDNMVQFNIEMPASVSSLPHDALVLHGCQIDVADADEAARTAIVDQLNELGRAPFVHAATAGLDLLAPDAISQAFFFDGVAQVREYQADPRFAALTASIAEQGLPITSFTLQLRHAPW